MEIILLQNTIIGHKRRVAGERVNVDDDIAKKMIASALAWSEQPKQPEQPEQPENAGPAAENAEPETENPEPVPDSPDPVAAKPKAAGKKTAARSKNERV